MEKLEIDQLLGVNRNGDHWESISNDPQIYLKGSFKKGWYKIRYHGTSEILRYLKLYIDYGGGFSEQNSVIIGKLDLKNSDEKVFEFKTDVVALRLDPGESPGIFQMENLAIEKIGAISILREAYHSYKELNYSDNIFRLFTKALKKIKKNGFKWLWKRAVTLMANRPDHQINRYEPYIFIEENKIIDVKYITNPLFSIIIPIYKLNSPYLENCLKSISFQSNSNFEVILISKQEVNIDFISRNIDVNKVQLITSTKDSLIGMIKEAVIVAQGDFITMIEQEDFLSINALHYIAENVGNGEDFIFTDEDRFLDSGEHFSPFYKESYFEEGELNSRIVGSFFVVKSGLTIESIGADVSSYDEFIQQCMINSNLMKHINKILYHRRATEITWPEEQTKKTNIISFYLPQFHAIPENDKWWGKGFTEWTNVTKAKPLFKDHYQSHVPSDLGYYNLIEDEGIQERQAELANKFGIFGFCYYYYWFDGKRLLEKPLNAMLENKDLDFPFCICWANESWTRRWDGQEKEMLMKQVHDKDSDQRFIEEVIPILKDERYIRLNGKDPVLLIYRAELFPDLKTTVQAWKEKCKSEGIHNLHVCMVQSFGQVDPTIYGCDSAVEFPPHGVYANEISKTIPDLVPEFSGNIYDYREVVDRSLQKKKSDHFTWFRGAMLSWDNTARRKSAANIFHYATPEEYEKWLVGLVDYTRRFNEDTQQIIFVNAWNEWAEGTHLEPDEKYGHQYLKATQRATLVR